MRFRRFKSERARAVAAVNKCGCESIWLAETDEQAVMRAFLCLKAGHAEADVSDALHRYEDSAVTR